MDIILTLINLVALIIVVYLIVKGNEKLYETFEKTQERFFASLEKSSQKGNLLLEKNSKEFLKVFKEVFKNDPRVIVQKEKEIEADKIENSIENEHEPEEVLLSDMPRVPIVDGVKIKFEDEEEIYPMNIDPIENYKEDKNVNPIEK
mgnify:CR=1 FL=1